MPYTTKWKGKGFYIKFSGLVTSDEIVQASLDMQGDERFDDLRYTLSDYLGIEDVGFEIDAFIKEISAHARINAAAAKSNPKIKRAIVAINETVITFTNLYDSESSSLGSPWKLKTFSSIAEAEDWVSR